jgi:hypothetical protein
MTTATITETLATPAGGSTASLRQTKVRLRLVAASGGVATAYTSGLTAVVADSWAAVEDDGTYSTRCGSSPRRSRRRPRPR